MGKYAKFGELLSQRLNHADRSAAWLAGRLDVSRATVTRWCNGETRPQDPEMVIRICDCLGIRAEEREEVLLSVGYGYQRMPISAGKNTSERSETEFSGELNSQYAQEPLPISKSVSSLPRALPSNPAVQLVLMLLGMGVLIFVYSWVTAKVGNGVRNVGYLIIFYAIFYVAFTYAMRYLKDWRRFIHYGLCTGAIGQLLGAILYSSCLFVAPSSNCLETQDSILIFERFGRVLFFALPSVVGTSLVLCSIFHLQSRYKSANRQTAVPYTMASEDFVAIITVVIVVIENAFVFWISRNLDGWIYDGASLGYMDPVSHVALPFVVGLLGFAICWTLEERWKKEIAFIYRLYFVTPITICLFVAIILYRYGRPSGFFAASTGIGVFTSYVAFAISIISLILLLLRASTK
ncbi:MAG: helix-turn-helix transcriptional regulator [Caldilineaceae bacterium]